MVVLHDEATRHHLYLPNTLLGEAIIAQCVIFLSRSGVYRCIVSGHVLGPADKTLSLHPCLK